MFHVGMKVVCVNDSLGNLPDTYKGVTIMHTLDGLKKGSIYTVREVGLKSWIDAAPAIKLIEIIRGIGPLGESPYWAHRFKPLEERKTDISIFKKLLNPANHQHDLCDND